MANWWDDAWDLAKEFGGAAWDLAKENPELAGAGAGLLVHHATGGKGEDNLQAMGLGAALGAGANYVADNWSTPSETAAPTTGSWGDPSAASEGSGVPYAAAPSQVPVSSSATMGTGVTGAGSADTYAARSGSGTYADSAGLTGDTGGDMMGPPASAAGEPTLLNRLGAGLKDVRDWAKDNEDVVGLAGKGIAAYLGSQAKSKAAAPVRAYNEQYRGKADEAMAANTALAEKKNAIVDQQVADYTAIAPQRSGQQAYAGTLSRIQKQAQKVADTETGKGYSAATVAANKRRGMVGASTGATSAAEAARVGAESTRRAGLGSIQYEKQDIPTYDTGYAGGVKTTEDAADTTEGAYSLYEDVFGLSKKKADEQVGA